MQFSFQNYIDISIPGYAPGSTSDKNQTSGTWTTYIKLKDKRGYSEIPEDEILVLENDQFSAAITLANYIGLSILLEIKPSGKTVTARDILKEIEIFRARNLQGQIETPVPAKLLLRFPPGDEDPILTVDAIMFLASLGVNLVGLESGNFTSDEDRRSLEQLMKEFNLVPLLNLNLSKVIPMSPYFLAAQPALTVEEGPVPARAVLIPLTEVVR